MRIKVSQDTLIAGQWTGVGVGNFEPHIAQHLIDIGSAVPYETKVVEAIQVKKLVPDSSVSQPGRVLRKKIARKSRDKVRL